MTIIRASRGDETLLAELAVKMWPYDSTEDLRKEFLELLESGEAACFIAYIDGNAAGFAQCGLRHDYVEGTGSSPVGYLEGIFVEKKYRNRGAAKALLAECEKWAEGKGCTEFASDCELDNEESLKFHLAMGFEEANRVICFRKDLRHSGGEL